MKFCELRPWEKFKLEEGKFTYIRLPDFPTDLIRVNCYCYDINEYRYITGGSGVKLVEDRDFSIVTEEAAINKLYETGWLEKHDKEISQNEYERGYKDGYEKGYSEGEWSKV